MYIALVLAQTVVLPIASTVVQLLLQGGDPALVAGRWFLFWGAGTRLLVAGLSQILRPGFTAREILGIADPDAHQLVQELGFMNVLVGSVAMASLVVPEWQLPMAIVAGGYLGLAGLRHVSKHGVGLAEAVATWTDLLVAAVLFVLIVRLVLQ